MKDAESKILSIVQSRGPVTPAQITKELKLDSTFVGAYLSNLAGSKKILITHAKIGTSPLYYVKGQEPKLIVLCKYLDDKEKRTHDLLNEKKVLSDKDQEPITRVALRQLKDFAIQVTVNLPEGPLTYWKYYLITNEEAAGLIKKELHLDKPSITEEQKIESTIEEVVPTSEEIDVQKKSLDDKQREIEDLRKELEKKQFEIEKQKIDQEKEELEKQKNEAETKYNLLKDKLKVDLEEQLKAEREQLAKERIELEKYKKEIMEELKSKKNTSNNSSVKSEETLEKPKNLSDENDDFVKQLVIYFDDKKIDVLEYSLIKKNSELDLIVEIPSVVGRVKYFCKAKNKKRCSEGDLSTAFVQAQSKNLPSLFVTTGEITKKAKDMLDKDFKNMLVSRIENGS